jgi:hypothetical protein
LRVEREQLQHRLRQLTAGLPNPADLSLIRAERGQLTADIGQIEKALEEADRLMLAAAEPHNESTAVVR